MKLRLIILASLSVITIFINAQAQALPNLQPPMIQDIFRFDVYSDIPFKAELVRLDNIARTAGNEPEAIIYFIAYGGEYSCKGEAQARALFSKNYLIERHGIPQERIMWKDGGYLEKSTIEVYFLPKGGIAPYPSMDAYQHNNRSRNCRSKYLRQFKRGKS
jgi:hypothetical protein